MPDVPAESKPRRKSVHDTVEPLLEKIAEEQNVTLYDLEYVKEGGDRVLRLYIDKENGVDINDCERVSRAAEAMLDELDPISEAYTLEVSSPGVERRLRRDRHFADNAGKKVEVRLFKNIEGRKVYKGILNGLIENQVSITDADGIGHLLDRQAISMCRISFFD